MHARVPQLDLSGPQPKQKNNMHHISAWILFFQSSSLSTWVKLCQPRWQIIFLLFGHPQYVSVIMYSFFLGTLWHFHVICFLGKRTLLLWKGLLPGLAILMHNVIRGCSDIIVEAAYSCPECLLLLWINLLF